MSTNPDTILLQPNSKEQVNYRQYESCNTCAMFNGRSQCNKVQGNVSPDAVCNLWTLREANLHMTGKQIIMEEYTKSIGGK